MVDAILNGYNGTILAYGQTAAGKSYTMEGSDLYDEVSKGVIPRAIEYLFDFISRNSEQAQFQVQVHNSIYYAPLFLILQFA